MNIKKLLLWFILIGFGLFSAWVMGEVGYFGIWRAGFDSPGSMQILADLAIGAGLICSWLVVDARRRGTNPWPWVVATILAGSLAPLAYLVTRKSEQPVSERRAAAA